MIEFPRVGFPMDPRLHINSEPALLDPYFRYSSLDISVERNGYQIDFTPARVEIDNRPYYNSVGLKDVRTMSEDYVSAAKSAARQGAVRASQNAEAVAHGASIGRLAYLQATRSIDQMLICVQPELPDINTVREELDVEYVRDDYTFNWDTGEAGAVYKPYSIEMWVEFLDRTDMKG